MPRLPPPPLYTLPPNHPWWNCGTQQLIETMSSFFLSKWNINFQDHYMSVFSKTVEMCLDSQRFYELIFFVKDMKISIHCSDFWRHCIMLWLEKSPPSPPLPLLPVPCIVCGVPLAGFLRSKETQRLWDYNVFHKISPPKQFTVTFWNMSKFPGPWTPHTYYLETITHLANSFEGICNFFYKSSLSFTNFNSLQFH